MKKSKKALALLMAATMTMGLAACGSEDEGDKTTPTPQGSSGN